MQSEKREYYAKPYYHDFLRFSAFWLVNRFAKKETIDIKSPEGYPDSIDLIIFIHNFVSINLLRILAFAFNIKLHKTTIPTNIMKNVRIYLRSILVNKKNQLMLFDSNRNGAVNNLVTVVPAGSTVIWKPDRCSGIKKILRIYSKTGKGNVFRKEPGRFWFTNTFCLKVPRVAEGEEAYSIDYLLYDKTRVSIDPVILIPPPPSHEP